MSDPETSAIIARRIVAALLDLAVVVVLIGLVHVMFGGAHYVVRALIWAVFAAAYYRVCNAVFGRTLGERALGVYVWTSTPKVP